MTLQIEEQRFPLAHNTGKFWQMRVPVAFAPKPAFTIGQFARLPNSYQVMKGITCYGIVVGMNYTRYSNPTDNVWFISVELPDYHPDAEFNDWEICEREEVLLAAQKDW